MNVIVCVYFSLFGCWLYVIINVINVIVLIKNFWFIIFYVSFLVNIFFFGWCGVFFIIFFLVLFKFNVIVGKLLVIKFIYKIWIGIIGSGNVSNIVNNIIKIFLIFDVNK